MGKWSHRPNRRFFRPERLPDPTPLPFHPKPPHPSEFRRDGIPQWEKEYCTLIGSIPWWKVIEAKNCMYGSSNVVQWDDSAGEEAFQNAKKRFWAGINGLQCDISLPALDIYIDEIDWNPYIDPDIVEEVDHEYFAPDDGEGNDTSGQKKRKTEHSATTSLDGHNSLPDTPTNPWECDNMQGSGDLKSEAQHWNQGNNHTDLINGDGNPWEDGITESNERMQNTAWQDSRDKSWGWSQMGKDSPSKNRDDGGHPWARDNCQGVTHVNANSRCGDPLNNSWGFNQAETKNLYRGENSLDCGPSRYNEASTKDRGWKGCREEEWHWKRCDSRISQRNNFDFRIKRSGGGARNDNGQKRERSYQNKAGYQNSGFQGSDSQPGGHWRRENYRKRVS